MGRKVTDLKVARKLSEKLETEFQYSYMITSPFSDLTSLPWTLPTKSSPIIHQG